MATTKPQRTTNPNRFQTPTKPAPVSTPVVKPPPKPPAVKPSSSQDQIRKEFFQLQQAQLRLQRKALNTQARELSLYNKQIAEQNQFYTQQLGLVQAQTTASANRATQYMQQLDLLTQTEQKQQQEAALQAQYADMVFNVERSGLGAKQSLQSRDVAARQRLVNNRPKVSRSIGMVRR